MSVQLQDILNVVDDHTSAKTGNVNQNRKIRAVNRAINYFKRKLNLPSDEKTYSFLWSDDQFFYTAPSDFFEELQMLFNDPSLNYTGNEWNFVPYQELLRKTGNNSKKLQWSVTTINGSRQIVVVGKNEEAGAIIDSLDTVGDWEASGDASGLEQDLLEKKVGDGALSFDITDSVGTAILSNDDFSLSVKTLFEKHGYFKLWSFMTDNDIDSIQLRLLVSSIKYWTITASVADDGSVFAENEWQKIGFSLDDALEVGDPEITDTVTEIQVRYDLGSGFTSAADFRIDHLFTTIPDKLDFIYKSNIKGTDSAGTTNRTNLSAVDDLAAFGDYDEDLTDIIGQRAAIDLFPSLRGDKDWYLAYKQDVKEILKDVGMKYPRRRVNKFPRTRIKR